MTSQVIAILIFIFFSLYCVSGQTPIAASKYLLVELEDELEEIEGLTKENVLQSRARALEANDVDETCGKKKIKCGTGQVCCLIALEEQEKICISENELCPSLPLIHQGDNDECNNPEIQGLSNHTEEVGLEYEDDNVPGLLVPCCKAKGIPDKCSHLCNVGDVVKKVDKNDGWRGPKEGSNGYECDTMNYRSCMKQCWDEAGNPKAPNGKKWWFNSNYNWKYFGWNAYYWKLIMG